MASLFRFCTSSKQKVAATLLGAAGLGGAALAFSMERGVQKLHAGDLILHPPNYPWDHNKFFKTYDANTLRRGYLVYKNVCKACHGMRQLAFRHFVDVFMSEEEGKAEAAEIMVMDGPDEEGNMFERPGKLSDYLPSPYKNDEEARFANNGALPPDLSYIVLARHGGEDYVFSVLTGYEDPPAGFQLNEGLHYNPYFKGGAIGMAQALYDGILDYPDGTPAPPSQLAKDVTVFLAWASKPELTERMLFGFQAMALLGLLLPLIMYKKVTTWSYLKTRKIAFKNPARPSEGGPK